MAKACSEDPCSGASRDPRSIVAQAQRLAGSDRAPVDAFLNLGAGPYPEESTITTGNAQPWYDSSQITRFFGGQPTAAQQASFDSAILQNVQQAFSQSGVPITLTDDPSVAAAHTLSLVSNTASSTLSDAFGMTELGKSGFSFIDQIAPNAQTLDQLEWIVAHNLSHELMLAFGVGENYDHTGNYIDAPDGQLGDDDQPDLDLQHGRGPGPPEPEPRDSDRHHGGRTQLHANRPRAGNDLFFLGLLWRPPSLPPRNRHHSAARRRP